MTRADRLAAGAGALAVGWAVAFSAIGLGKLRWFLYEDFDLALFAQAVHGAAHGSFDSSIRGMPWLADHSSLILLPLAPLAAWLPPAALLVVLQSVALAAGAIAVQRIARRELGSPLAALALAAAWLLQPALMNVALFEFHPEAFAVPLLLLAWDAWRRGRRGAMLAAAIGALACKEDVAFAVMGLALAVALAHRPRWRGDALALAGAALVFGALTFLVLKPMAPGVVDYGRLYERWGPSTGAALRAMATHPARVLGALVATPGDAVDTAAKHRFGLQLLGPWAFLPLLAPLAWLPLAPIVLEHLMSDRLEQHVIVYQYGALILPWLAGGAIAAIGGLARAGRAGAPAPGPDPARARALALVVLLAAASAQWRWGPFARGAEARPVPPPERSFPDGTDRAMRPFRIRALARLDDRDGIVSGFETLAPLATRAHLESAHHVLGGTYTFSEVPYPTPHGIHAALVDTGVRTTRDWLDSDSPARWRAMVQANRLAPVEEHGDLTLWLDGAPDTLALVAAGAIVGARTPVVSYEDRLRLVGAVLDSTPVAAGDELPLTLCWQRHGELDGTVQMTLALQPLTGDDRSWRAAHTRLVGYGLWSVDDWETDRTMVERYRWVLPDDLAPGRYRAGIAVMDRTERLRRFAVTPPADAEGYVGLAIVTVRGPGTARGRTR